MRVSGLKPLGFFSHAASHPGVVFSERPIRFGPCCRQPSMTWRSAPGSETWQPWQPTFSKRTLPRAASPFAGAGYASFPDFSNRYAVTPAIIVSVSLWPDGVSKFSR